jgi:hypothetical protein
MSAAYEQVDIPLCLASIMFVLFMLWLIEKPRARSRSRRSWQFLLRSECGAAYTLSYVMVVPIFAWLMCLIAESVVMMSAKLGTEYAAFVAARTASVWSSAGGWKKAEEKGREAAFQAFVPFASGTQPIRPLDAGKVASIVGNRRTAAFLLANKEFASQSVSAKYLTKKYLNAHMALNVTFDGAPSAWNSPIKVTAEYRYPFQVPGIGRLLGKRGLDGRFYYPLRTTVSLPNEGPQNKTQTLGIGYGTL